MKEIPEKIKKILKNIPQKSGIFILRNKLNKEIFIGCALNVKKTLSTFFIRKKLKKKSLKFIDQVTSIEFIQVDDRDKIIKEQNKLIKKFKPKYNYFNEDISSEISEKLELIPHKPGVYLMKDKNLKVIYVGKSKNLKNRVSSYFLKNKKDFKTIALVKKIKIFDYIITNTEHEALLLENNLIKKYMPKYNILMKDDKTYPFIQITKEDFPRVTITRRLLKNGSNFFGPYTKSKYAWNALKIIHKIFPIRDCKLNISASEKTRNRPCINYQIGKCSAPCTLEVSKKEYGKYISSIKAFLRGNDEEIRKNLIEIMESFSEKLQFEKAAKIRDRLKILDGIYQNQAIYFKDGKNRHAIGIYKEEELAAASILKFVNGKLLNREIFPIKNVKELPKEKILSAFLKQYYLSKLDKLPQEIFVAHDFDDFDSINEVLEEKLIIPQRGNKKKVLKMAKDNAFTYVEEIKLKKIKRKIRTKKPIIELKEKLNLSKLPLKIACFDISHLQGTETVSSSVFFVNGKPSKKNYKKFIIKTVNKIDDFASLQETLERYIKRINSGDFLKPDLFVIDGGKGQLSSVMKTIKKLGVTDIDVISLAKRLEEVFIPNSKKSVIMKRSSSALKILINIRDEAHRFAITFHRDKRKKRTINSKLTTIKGVGQNLSISLLMEFGSIENLKKQTAYKLTVIKGIGIEKAKYILDELKKF